MATKKWLQFCKLYALLVVGFALKWIKCKIIPLNFGNNKWSCQSNSHDCHFDINNRCGCSLDHQQQSILFALFADHFKCARLLSPNQSGGPISPGDFWFSWWWRKQYSSCCLNYPRTTQTTSRSTIPRRFVALRDDTLSAICFVHLVCLSLA